MNLSSLYKEKFWIFSETSITQYTKKILENNNLITDNKKEATILICRFEDRVTSSYLRSFCSLKYLVTVTTGTTHIDLDYLSKNGIKLLTLFDSKEELLKIKSSSEHAVLLTLCAIKRVGSYWIGPTNKKSDRKSYIPINKKLSHPIDEISDIKLSILGLGRIGSYVGKAFTFLGAKIIYNDLKPIVNSDYEYVQLDKLNSSDVLLISCDLNKARRNISSKKVLEKSNIKSIINIAREECVDYAALIQWLKLSKYNYYYTDVFDSISREQLELINNSKFVESQVIKTPHVGGLSKNSFKKADIIVIEKLNQIIEQNNS